MVRVKNIPLGSRDSWLADHEILHGKVLLVWIKFHQSMVFKHFSPDVLTVACMEQAVVKIVPK